MVNRVSGNSRERESYGRCRVTACDALDLAGNRMPIAERSAAWSRPGCGPGCLDYGRLCIFQSIRGQWGIQPIRGNLRSKEYEGYRESPGHGIRTGDKVQFRHRVIESAEFCPFCPAVSDASRYRILPLPALTA